MKVLIVDDEPLARSRLVRLLAQQGGYTVVAEAGNGEQAITACNEYHPDVVLMDIRMPVMDGLQAARYLSVADAPPAVIFCTAYDDYALAAFDTNAVGYLLKPVNRDKLEQALAKAKKLNRVQLSALTRTGNEQAAAAPARSHISSKSSRGIELIPLPEVRYFLADQKYITVYYLLDGVLREALIDEPLKELEDELADSFVRIHRNALVAIAHIQGLEKDPQGVRLKLSGVAQGPQVSRRHMTAVKKRLQLL